MNARTILPALHRPDLAGGRGYPSQITQPHLPHHRPGLVWVGGRATCPEYPQTGPGQEVQTPPALDRTWTGGNRPTGGQKQILRVRVVNN